jgi:hypothetical protein
MSLEEKEEVQAKDIGSIFNKVKAENFTDLQKEMVIQVQNTLNRQDQNGTAPCQLKNYIHRTRKEY